MKGEKLILAFLLMLSVMYIVNIVHAESYSVKLIEISENYNIIYPFSEGLAKVERDRKCGFIDETGKLVVPLEYDTAEFFKEGLARISKDGKYGFVDKTGRVIVPLEYNYIMNFSDGLAKFIRDDYGFIDKSGKVVLSLKYDLISDFEEGFARVSKDGKSGYIDKSGRLIVSASDYDSIGRFSEGLVAVEKRGKIGFVDKTGKLVIPIEYDIRDFNEELAFNEGLVRVSKDGKYGFVDKTGKIIIPFEYDEVWDFSEGLARVVRDGKSGFIDKSGRIIIPLEYTWTIENWVFKEELAGIRKDNKWGFIDKTGNIIVPFEYDAVGNFKEGLAMIEKNNKYGYIDKTGRVVVPVEYDCQYVSVFRTGYVAEGVYNFKNGVAPIYKGFNSYGYVDKTGKIIVAPLEYDIRGDLREGSVVVRKDGKWGILQIVKEEQPQNSQQLTATPTSSTVLVNSKNVVFDAYTINGNNYFKLRDLAYALNGTSKNFEVTWDNKNKSILLLGNKSYTSVGGEMSSKGTGTKVPVTTSSKIFIDGKEVNLIAYTIEGNNYFKLRDIGEIFNFNVSWIGGGVNTIVIDSSESYTAD